MVWCQICDKPLPEPMMAQYTDAYMWGPMMAQYTDAYKGEMS